MAKMETLQMGNREDKLLRKNSDEKRPTPEKYGGEMNADAHPFVSKLNSLRSPTSLWMCVDKMEKRSNIQATLLERHAPWPLRNQGESRRLLFLGNCFPNL